MKYLIKKVLDSKNFLVCLNISRSNTFSTKKTFHLIRPKELTKIDDETWLNKLPHSPIDSYVSALDTPFPQLRVCALYVS